MPTTRTRPAEPMPVRTAVRDLLDAVDTCRDLLDCRRPEGEDTCLHRARKGRKDTLCRTCRLVQALDHLEDTVQ